MPPFDENGNMMPLWENPPMYIKDQDGTIHEIPREIPTVKLTENPEEHDYLPPLEFPPDQTWVLNGKASRSLIQAMRKAKKETDMFRKKVYRLCRRGHRLEEKVRRERLKGAPMERLWDIQLRHTQVIGELMNTLKKWRL